MNENKKIEDALKVANHPALTTPAWTFGKSDIIRKIKIGKKKPAGKGKRQKKFGRKK